MGIVGPVQKPGECEPCPKSGPVADRPGTRRMMIWFRGQSDSAVQARNTRKLSERRDGQRARAFVWVSMMLKADCSGSSLLVLALSVVYGHQDVRYQYAYAKLLPHDGTYDFPQVFLTKWGEQRAGGLGTICRMSA